MTSPVLRLRYFPPGILYDTGIKTICDAIENGS
jgi:hypothetical protein